MSSRGCRHLQATPGHSLAQHPIYRHRRVHPLERLRAQLLTPHIAIDQAPGGGADHHRIGFRQPLQPCRQIRRVPEGQAFVPSPTAHLPHDHQTGVNAHPHGQPSAGIVHQAARERRYGCDQRQSGAHGTLGVVLMRLGIAKIDQQPIPEVLRNMAVKALDDRGASVLVGAHQRTVVLRVELPGQGGRLDQITEQHGELAAFSVRGMAGPWRRGNRGGLGRLWRACARVWGSVWGDRWRREAYATLAAKNVACRVHETAGRTGPGQLYAASTTEVHLFKVGKTAVCAQYLHTSPP